MNLERIINNIDRDITHYNDELSKFNSLNEFETFLQELDNNFENINLNKYKMCLSELLDEEKIDYYIDLINNIKKVYSFLTLELDLAKSLKKDLDEFKITIKSLYDDKIKIKNNLNELIDKLTRLKEYLIDFDNFDINNLNDLHNLLEIYKIDPIDELEINAKLLKLIFNIQKETEIISKDDIDDIVDIIDKNQESILEELAKLEDDETKEFTEKIKEIKKILDDNSELLNEFYTFNKGISSYILNKDFENLRIMCNYNSLDFNKLSLLSIIIPSLVNLEEMTSEIEGYTKRELIELMNEYLNDYYKALQLYKKQKEELETSSKVEITETNKEIETEKELEEEEKDIDEKARILESNEETFLANCYNFILYAKDRNGNFFIDENLTIGDKNERDVKTKGISKAVKLWATQIMHKGLADSYIDKRSVDDKLYPGTDTEDEKAYDKREFKPRRFRCTNKAREAYMIIPTCQENMTKLAKYFNNPNINTFSEVIMFIGVDFIPSKKTTEYKYLNKLVDDNKEYKRKILDLFNDPQTDINVLVEIIEESTRYSLKHIRTNEDLEVKKGKH